MEVVVVVVVVLVVVVKVVEVEQHQRPHGGRYKADPFPGTR